jgi:hypothetical protein
MPVGHRTNSATRRMPRPIAELQRSPQISPVLQSACTAALAVRRVLSGSLSLVVNRLREGALDRAQTAEALPLQMVGSAGDVKDRADLFWLEARDQSTGLFRRDSDKVNVLARSLLHYLIHDRQ